jgi:hypothetical protein
MASRRRDGPPRRSSGTGPCDQNRMLCFWIRSAMLVGGSEKGCRRLSSPRRPRLPYPSTTSPDVSGSADTHEARLIRTPWIMMDRNRLCSCSSITETMLSLVGSNRKAENRSLLVYGDLTDMTRLQSFQSDVTTIFGPTRTRRPRDAC